MMRKTSLILFGAAAGVAVAWVGYDLLLGCPRPISFLGRARAALTAEPIQESRGESRGLERVEAMKHTCRTERDASSTRPCRVDLHYRTPISRTSRRIRARRDRTAWLMKQSDSNPSPNSKFRNNREKYRENRKFGLKFTTASPANAAAMRGFKRNSLSKLTGNDFGVTGKL
jgi:hypothetical protein